jgi:peroxiredoxin
MSAMKIHLYTGIGFVFVVTALALLAFYPVVSALYALTAFFFAMRELSKYTSRFQFVTIYLAALVLGLNLDWPLTHFPLFVLTLLFVATGSVSRIMFFRTFGYTKHSWLEPLGLSLALITYFTAHLLQSTGWMGWVFPLPVLAFLSVYVFGILKDKMQLLNFTKGGYKIAIGAKAPDFLLPDQDGQMTSLESFLGERHLLLVFVRGDWCPGCHMMLRTYQKEASKFKTKNIFVLAIGPDPVGVNREMVEKLDLDFKVLSDEKQRTAMIYGVQLDQYDNDFAEKYEEGIPLPASFLVDKKGIVRYVSRPDNVGEFLDPRTIFPILDKLN